MTRRIFKAICLVAMAALLAATVCIIGALYEYSTGAQQNQMRVQTAMAAQGVENEGTAFFEGLDTGNIRITWIDSDGSVIYDTASEASGMENHLDREEVAEALETGYGESVRYSSTLTERMFYSAQLLSDGTVVRVSGSQYTMLTIMAGLLRTIIIIVVAVGVVSLLLARRLAKKIVSPLNELDLDRPAPSSEYEELSPLLHRLESQRNELRRQADQLKRRRDEFNAATENMAEGIVLLNEQGIILSINNAAVRLLQLDSGCIGGELLHLRDSQPLWELLHRTTAGEHGELELELDGCGYQLNASPVFSEAAVCGIVLLIFDVSEKEKAEKLRREFTANVSHELKTPLHSISGYAELMQGGLVKQEDIPGFAGRIYTEAQRMISLVDDIIRLSHLDEGAADLPRTEVDLYATAQTALKSLEAEAERNNVSLTLSGGPAVVHDVAQLLSITVFNLCDNAIKYNRENGSVSVKVEDLGDAALLTVSDTGIGIDKEHQERIFERFYRVDKSHSKEVGGTGLGLSIVKHAALLHGAEIKLHSVPGEGTTITVRFPK